MSRYGTILGGRANARTAVVQTANAEDLPALASAAIQATFQGLQNGVATSITLTGAGDGHMFFLELEGADAANVDGGADLVGGQVVMAATAEDLQAQIRALQNTSPVLDVQIAGASKGQRVMALVLYGTLRQSGSGSAVLVFRPGGVRAGNVYPVWSDLVAACASLSGMRIIWLDDSIQPCQVPSGTWDLGAHDEVQFQGDGTRLDPTPLAFLNGARITEVSVFRDVAIDAQGGAPAMLITSPKRKIIFTGTTTGQTSGTAAFVQNVSATVLLLICDEYASINAGTAPFFDNQLVGASLTMQGFQGGFIDTNVLSGVAGASYSGIRGSSSVFVASAQAGVPGGVIAIGIWDISDGVQYSPAVLADWAGVSPGNVAKAFDRIAAKITPIP